MTLGCVKFLTRDYYKDDPENPASDNQHFLHKNENLITK